MALTGSETLLVLGQNPSGVPAASTQQTTTGAIAALAASFNTTRIVSTLSTVGAGTITAAILAGGIVTRSGSQSGTAFTDTTATAAQILAALPSGIAIGDSILFVYQNTTNAPATITGGTGVTVSGIITAYANSTSTFLLTYTAANTFTMVGYDRGVYPAFGTFLAGGASATRTITEAQVSPNSQIDITVQTQAGAALMGPFVTTVTAGTGFTVRFGTADTSLYSYSVTY